MAKVNPAAKLGRPPKSPIDRPAQRGSAPLGKARLGGLIGKNKKVLAVLDKHGITFCAGCYLTLFSTVERAAAYHAVTDKETFLKDLRKALGR